MPVLIVSEGQPEFGDWVKVQINRAARAYINGEAPVPVTITHDGGDSIVAQVANSNGRRLWRSIDRQWNPLPENSVIHWPEPPAETPKRFESPRLRADGTTAQRRHPDT